MAKPKCKPNEYINNREMWEELVEYKRLKELDPDTPVPLCLWEKFTILAKRTAGAVNYSSYTYKDEFIDDAVIHCVIQIDKFNVNKSKNPYSYFRNAVNRVILQFIRKEKQESAKKDACLHRYNGVIDKMINEAHGAKSSKEKRDYYGF